MDPGVLRKIRENGPRDLWQCLKLKKRNSSFFTPQRLGEWSPAQGAKKDLPHPLGQEREV